MWYAHGGKGHCAKCNRKSPAAEVEEAEATENPVTAADRNMERELASTSPVTRKPRQKKVRVKKDSDKVNPFAAKLGKDADQLVYKMYKKNGCKLREIATELGVTMNSVKSQLLKYYMARDTE
jgi:DNA-directed RNA polymerase specialized sigma subunit